MHAASLILSGGMALGAYQAGAFEAFDRSGRLHFVAIAGSSIGAINGAIIAGNPPERRAERLRAFWARVATEALPSRWADPFGLAAQGPLRNIRNWTNVLATRLAGVRGLFHLAPGVRILSGTPAFYDTRDTVETLSALIDFARLNDGEVRFCCAATDVASAETIIFDTGRGDRIGVEHLLASGGMLPNMQPVQVGDRVLADGGLSANAPLEPFLLPEHARSLPPLAILIDLFAPDNVVPASLEQAMQRSTELQFAAQTKLRLEAICALHERADTSGMDLLHLSLQGGGDEAGSERQYDFSRETLAERHAAGVADAVEALGQVTKQTPERKPGLHVHRIRREG